MSMTTTQERCTDAQVVTQDEEVGVTCPPAVVRLPALEETEEPGTGVDLRAALAAAVNAVGQITPTKADPLPKPPPQPRPVVHQRPRRGFE